MGPKDLQDTIRLAELLCLEKNNNPFLIFKPNEFRCNTKQYFQLMSAVTTNSDFLSAAVIGVNGRMNHATCIWKADKDNLHLTESGDLKILGREQAVICMTAQQPIVRDAYNLDPNHVWILVRSSNKSRARQEIEFLTSLFPNGGEVLVSVYLSEDEEEEISTSEEVSEEDSEEDLDVDMSHMRL